MASTNPTIIERGGKPGIGAGLVVKIDDVDAYDVAAMDSRPDAEFIVNIDEADAYDVAPTGSRPTKTFPCPVTGMDAIVRDPY